MYIADHYNSRIRKVTVSTQIPTVVPTAIPTVQPSCAPSSIPSNPPVDIITTIAGTGTSSFSGDNGAATSATLYYPREVTIDASGRILYYCLLHCYTVSSAMFDGIFFYFPLIFPCPI